MADKEVKVIIRAVDEFSKTFNKLDDDVAQVAKAMEKTSSAFDDFANASGSSKLKSMANTFGEIAEGMQTIQGRAGLAYRAIATLVENFNKLYDASKKDFSARLQNLSDVCSTVVGAVGNVGKGFLDLVSNVTGTDLSFQGLVSTTANFEQNMARVKTLTGAQNDGFTKMNELCQRLATESVFGVEELSAGMIDLASAGFDVTDILQNMETVTKLATSGNLDLARSAEIVANGMNAFNMEVTKANTLDFANSLAFVADKSATDINQLGEALSNCGAQAGSMGYSIQDVSVLLGIMADNGIKSGRAGTALKNIMNRVATGNSSASKAIKEYNLQGFEQEMLNGNLAGAMMKLCQETEKYTPAQKQAIATAIAGAYGMNGLLAVMNKGTEGIKEYCKALEEENKLEEEKRRLSVLTAEVMDTTKGKMEQLSSVMGVLASEFKDKLDPYVQKALDGVLSFAKGLMEVDKQGNVTIKSLSQLAQESVKWGQNLEKGIQTAINGIKGFVTGGGLDNILTIGTNIIQGICKGISNNKQNLQETFSATIKKACEFIKNNAPAIGQAGKDILEALANAIRENEAVITEALEALCSTFSSWAEGSGALKAVGGKFADTLVKGMAEAFVPEKAGAFKEKWNAFWDFFTVGDGKGDIKEGSTSSKGGLGEFFSKIPGKIKEWMFGEAWAGEVDPEAQKAGEKTGKTTATGMKDGVDKNGQPIVDSAVKTGEDSAKGIETALESMDLEYLKSLGKEMENVGTITTNTATQMSTGFTNITNSARTQFTNFANIVRNQMTNVSNSIRTQLLNCTNIVKNQATNMSNSVRTAFVNMSNIAKNQFTNIANSIRTQMTNCTNIVKNQATNMANSIRNSFTNMTNIVKNQFTNIANSIRTQMTNCTNIIRNQATNMTNIVKNQATNMANAVRTGFTNMANIARNQFVNIANICRNQMLNCTNIIRNQCTNMNNAVRTGFVNMANIVRNQMLNCTNIVRNQASNMSNALSQGMSKMASSATSAMNRVISAVRSGMATAKSIASQPITINIRSNISRKVTTTHVAGGLKQTMSNINGNISRIGGANVMSNGGINNRILPQASGGEYAFTIPIVVDGREIARASARYSEKELARLEKRANRRRGD